MYRHWISQSQTRQSQQLQQQSCGLREKRLCTHVNARAIRAPWVTPSHVSLHPLLALAAQRTSNNWGVVQERCLQMSAMHLLRTKETIIHLCHTNKPQVSILINMCKAKLWHFFCGHLLQLLQRQPKCGLFTVFTSVYHVYFLPLWSERIHRNELKWQYLSTIFPSRPVVKV